MNLALGVVLVLGVMILVHEFGHFIAAKLCGVRVERFSIGFPPRLWGVHYKGTDYCIGAVPLGGYVRMAGQDLSDADRGDSPAPSGKQDELMSKPRWQRAIIVFAGPAVNLLLPVVLLLGFYLVKGSPYSPDLEQPVQVVALRTPLAGETNPLEVGDRVISINGVDVPTWEKALTVLGEVSPGDTVRLQIERVGARRTVSTVVPDAERAGQLLGYPPVAPVLSEIQSKRPAYRAGLKVGDQVVAVNGGRIVDSTQFVDAVKGSGGKPLEITVLRKGQQVTAQAVPQEGRNDLGEVVWQLGVAVGGRTAYRRVGLFEAGNMAVAATVEGIGGVAHVMGKLFSGRTSVRQLQGVLGIARMSGRAVEEGPSAVINLMVLISVNLGILNLLPIPILDGGHILLLAIEGGLRRDLSLGFKERFVQVGFVFLLLLFGFVMYNDVVRILPVR